MCGLGYSGVHLDGFLCGQGHGFKGCVRKRGMCQRGGYRGIWGGGVSTTRGEFEQGEDTGIRVRGGSRVW